jgi:hypothetical protein
MSFAGTLARYPARVEFTVEEHDGVTRLSNTVDLELTGAARLLDGVATGRIRSAVAENPCGTQEAPRVRLLMPRSSGSNGRTVQQSSPTFKQAIADDMHLAAAEVIWVLLFES